MTRKSGDKKPTCAHCKKQGHKKDECYKLKAELKAKADAASKADANKPNDLNAKVAQVDREDDTVLRVFVADAMKANSELTHWLVDSGASAHSPPRTAGCQHHTASGWATSATSSPLAKGQSTSSSAIASPPSSSHASSTYLSSTGTSYRSPSSRQKDATSSSSRTDVVSSTQGMLASLAQPPSRRDSMYSRAKPPHLSACMSLHSILRKSPTRTTPVPCLMTSPHLSQTSRRPRSRPGTAVLLI